MRYIKIHLFQFIFDPDVSQPIGLKFKLKVINKDQYKLSASGNDVLFYNYSSSKITDIVDEVDISDIYNFNEEIVIENVRFKIILHDEYDDKFFDKVNYCFFFNSFEDLTDYYKSAIEIEPFDNQSTIAIVTLKGQNIDKCVDFVNALNEGYLQRNKDLQNHIATNTIQYINKQLSGISDSLNVAGKKLQEFRSTNNVMDITLKSGRIYDQLQALETEKAGLVVTSKYYNYINEYFDQNSDYSQLLAPSAMGIEDPTLNNLIRELIVLNAERQNLIDNNQQKSPYLRQLNIKLENLKNTIIENIRYIQKTSDIVISELDKQIADLNTEINKLPKTERNLVGIEREFNVKRRDLYIFY
ncbi:MAG: hypothetical protein HC906_04400 [Bacteroidales bacterium]|nr:hypothetical protein [Bacteroidales bacterium]